MPNSMLLDEQNTTRKVKGFTLNFYFYMKHLVSEPIFIAINYVEMRCFYAKNRI